MVFTNLDQQKTFENSLISEQRTISTLAQERALAPLFRQRPQEYERFFQSKDRKNLFRFYSLIPNDDLTVFEFYGQRDEEGNIINLFYLTEAQGTLLAFVDAMVELAHRRDYRGLGQLSAREVESFLRDRNSVEAIPKDLLNQEAILRSFEPLQNFLKTGSFHERDSQVKSRLKNSQEIVCHCLRLDLQDIENYILENQINQIDQLKEGTKAGTRCGLCVSPEKGEGRTYFLDHILDSVQARQKSGLDQRENFESGSSPLTKVQLIPFIVLPFGNASGAPGDEAIEFSQLPFYEKVMLVEKILDLGVRPFLRSDGGDVVLLDVQDSTVVLSYQGNCADCLSSTKGTWQFIQRVFKNCPTLDQIKIKIFQKKLKLSQINDNFGR